MLDSSLNKTRSFDKLHDKKETGHRVEDIVSEVIGSERKQIAAIEADLWTGQTFDESQEFIANVEWYSVLVVVT